jgi:hypothetical protein
MVRCKNGTHRNKLSGDCEAKRSVKKRVAASPKPKSAKKKRCENGTRRNKAGNCESLGNAVGKNKLDAERNKAFKQMYSEKPKISPETYAKVDENILDILQDDDENDIKFRKKIKEMRLTYQLTDFLRRRDKNLHRDLYEQYNHDMDAVAQDLIIEVVYGLMHEYSKGYLSASDSLYIDPKY